LLAAVFLLSAIAPAAALPARRGTPAGNHVGNARVEAEASAASAAAYAPGQRGRRTREVKVYLVALDDNGRRGRKVGCNDSLVPVTRTVAAGATPLNAAIAELLSVPREYEGGLGNYWHGENLRVQSAVIRGGVATIRIRGRVSVAGVCDAPRIEGQIRETARQFRGVRSVKVFVDGQRLADALR
ncbi:MAG TPA: GerMN domain-containing protein, partial [Pyrinomonadaceae bacterium]